MKHKQRVDPSDPSCFHHLQSLHGFLTFVSVATFLVTVVGWPVCVFNTSNYVCNNPNYPCLIVEKGNWEQSDSYYCAPDSRSSQSSIPAVHVDEPCGAALAWQWSFVGALCSSIFFGLLWCLPQPRHRLTIRLFPPLLLLFNHNVTRSSVKRGWLQSSQVAALIVEQTGMSQIDCQIHPY